MAELRGSGNARKPVDIDRGAIQWRVRWRCERGDLAITAGGRRLGRDDCPGTGEAKSIEEGAVSLDVSASGPWRLSVEQQVDTALREPPLPGLRAAGARKVASGRFFRIERRGRGTAALHRLPNGRLALRLEGFDTAANTDLFVWVSRARRPRTTSEALRSPHVSIAALKSTLGDQNYLLPPNLDAGAVRSVVIWCEPIRIAYTAAALTR